MTAEESVPERRKDPKFVEAYDALEDEFAVAAARIKAHSEAAMTKGTGREGDGNDTGFVACLESGKTMPSTRKLKRFAKATRARLRISFEPEKRGG